MMHFLGNFGVIEMIMSFTGTQQSISADTEALGFCRGSASIPRGFISIEVGADGTMSECQTVADVVDSGKESPMIGEQCETLPHV